ncbi:MAG: hypothetical protein WCY32_15390 [Burkholderiaceae bacterium]
MRRSPTAILALLLIVCRPAFVEAAAAVEPARVFERVSPSIPVVEALDRQGRVIASASAIAIGDGRFVGACTTFAGSDAIRILAGKRLASAELAARDGRRNLCLLTASGMQSVPAIEISSPSGLPRRSLIVASGWRFR